MFAEENKCALEMISKQRDFTLAWHLCHIVNWILSIWLPIPHFSPPHWSRMIAATGRQQKLDSHKVPTSLPLYDVRKAQELTVLDLVPDRNHLLLLLWSSVHEEKASSSSSSDHGLKLVESSDCNVHSSGLYWENCISISYLLKVLFSRSFSCSSSPSPSSSFFFNMVPTHILQTHKTCLLMNLTKKYPLKKIFMTFVSGLCLCVSLSTLSKSKRGFASKISDWIFVSQSSRVHTYIRQEKRKKKTPAGRR